MKNLTLSLGLLLAATLAIHADTLLFSDSFENDGTGYNVPNGSSTPAYNNPVATNSDPTGGTFALVQINPGTITGQDGNDYLAIDNAGTGVTDTLTTKASDNIGTYAFGTTYTLSGLMRQNFGGLSSPGNLFTGKLELYDATTNTILATASHNFATGDANFDPYSLTFNTIGHLSILGDTIQIGLEADSNAGSFQDIDFDDIKLTSQADVVTPEPGTYALLLFGLSALGLTAHLRRRA